MPRPFVIELKRDIDNYELVFAGQVKQHEDTQCTYLLKPNSHVEPDCFEPIEA